MLALIEELGVTPEDNALVCLPPISCAARGCSELLVAVLWCRRSDCVPLPCHCSHESTASLAVASAGPCADCALHSMW